ncbi:unnamed protein product [Rotaria sp. Silwood1]|nr:unnamed protein product [Rotaria sp. Silwood1]
MVIELLQVFARSCGNTLPNRIVFYRDGIDDGQFQKVLDNEDGKQTSNLEAGTVIDVDITHPSQFDFYLCSQAAIMGTSRPALYHVLHDENGFNSNDIQELTYWLCHTDARCSKSVSIPALVHYAHLAVYASVAYKFNDNDDETLEIDDDESTSETITLEDIKTKVMILNNNIQDTMWFV